MDPLQSFTTSRLLIVAGKGGVVFWGILAVVVVGLLFVISRLLPKATQS